MAFPFGISVNVFEPGLGGIPSTAVFVENLAGRMESYEHTIAATFGFETLTVTLVMDQDEATDWLSRGLMRSCIAYSPDADVIWEGYLATIEAQFGQEQRSVTLDGMANRVVAHYTTYVGVPLVTSTYDDAASQALYGYKAQTFSLGAPTDGGGVAANAFAARALAQYKNPVMAPTTALQTGELGGIQVTLKFVGWYDTLGWLLAFNSSTTLTSTTTQVGTLLGLIASGNAFVSTSTANIISSGVTDTEYISVDTPYRQKIEALLAIGDSSNNRLAWGVYENRAFSVAVWAGASPTTIHYQRNLGSALLLDGNGGDVSLWDARPDRMYQVVELLDVAPVTTAPDAAGRFYVERVTFRVDRGGMALQLEPQASNSIDAQLARFNRS